MAGRTQHPSTVRRKKRPQPPVYGGVGSSYEDKDNDFLCPICFEMIEEAHMTKCGHSFCHKCIRSCLEQSNRCPKCNQVLDKPDQIFPNFLLDELVQKQRQKLSEQKRLKTNHSNGFSQEIMDTLEPDSLDIHHVNTLLDYLSQKKLQLEGDGQLAQHQVLKEFLLKVRAKKQEMLDQLNLELSLIDEDVRRVEALLSDHRRKYPKSCTLPSSTPSINGVIDTSSLKSDASSPTATPNATASSTNGKGDSLNSTSNSQVMGQEFFNGSRTGSTSNSQTMGQEGFNGSRTAGRQWLQTTMASRRKKVDQHFEDLEQCYFGLRTPQRDKISEPSTQGAVGASSSTIFNSANFQSDRDSFEEFQESLSKFTKYTSFRPLATLSYASDIYNPSSIVSSIEFDRDCDYFAIAGVTKKIKVFEYGTVIRDTVDMHYPVTEMVCNSKISSIIWSSYHKSMLASSDYEGTVTLWDAFTGVKSRIFQEHEKRCWSVDFNRMDPKLLASGSDDSKVKLWSTNVEHSVACLEAKANVCCVKFNPESRFHLAFGSADHCVHYYDLRKLKTPVSVFKGHRKAVSYTKFVSPTEIVSASTDSQLKLWGISKQHCLRTYRGHTNEKNFVGLASDGDYIACGSENNSLYVYYKGLSKQLLTFKFDTVRSVLEKEKREEDTNEFVSAVCWRPGSNVLVAANSQGTIKVLELV